jgi:hypothetical protein
MDGSFDTEIKKAIRLAYSEDFGQELTPDELTNMLEFMVSSIRGKYKEIHDGDDLPLSDLDICLVYAYYKDACDEWRGKKKVLQLQTEVDEIRSMWRKKWQKEIPLSGYEIHDLGALWKMITNRRYDEEDDV